MIKIKNLSFSYYKGTKNVVNNLSFQIAKGKVNVLLGLNGCGKTTLIKLMAGLLTPVKGDIYYMDENLKSISIAKRSKLFSYVSQRSNYNDDYLVKEYLKYSFVNSLKFYESPTEEQIKIVNEISSKFNFTHLLNKKMGQLSGGERQIITIAAAIIQDTPIILLDEPTSALDLKNQNTVLSTLNEIANKGTTIVLSSHNPNHALFLNANVMLMKDGNIVEYGNSKDIINVENLKKVYGESICFGDELPYREISFKRK